MFGIILGWLIVFGIPLFVVVMLLLRKGKLLLAIGKKLGQLILGLTLLIMLFIFNYVVISQTMLVAKGTRTIGITKEASKRMEIVRRKGPNNNRYSTHEMRYVAKVGYNDQHGASFETEIYVSKEVFDGKIKGEEKLVYYNPKNPKESTVSTPFGYIYGVGIPYYAYSIRALVIEVLVIAYFIFHQKKGNYEKKKLR